MLTSTLTAPSVAAAGLPPYTGSFGRREAGHLLRRTLFGPTLAEIDTAVSRGLQATLDTLFSPASPPPPPVNHVFTEDRNVPIGQTWVNSPFLEDVDVAGYRWHSLRGWYINHLIDSPTRVQEKMVMFWCNHFGMAEAGAGDHRVQYDYIRLFREYATGNFRELIERITVHPSMLQFLNGRYNNKNAPDENYARELLELFTVQKGQPGDVNYTEDDIREIARVLTGWRVENLWSTNEAPVRSYFHQPWHDEGTKQLSSYFKNAVIENGGAEEYKTLIGIIFQHPETARAICRDLYLYFVGEIDEGTTWVINRMARLLRESDYEIAPVLRNLFASQRFMAPGRHSTIVKNPYEFMLSIARPLGGYGHLALDLNIRTRLAGSYHWWAKQADQDVFYPPTVSGWKAYYQAPGFYRNWISAPTLQKRRELVESMTWNGVWAEGEPRPFDWFGFLDGLTNPEDINDLIDDVALVFMARRLHPDQVVGLKEVLLPGLPDFEWTIQYRQYRANPDNPEYVNPIFNKLRDFFRALFSTAEFQLL